MGALTSTRRRRARLVGQVRIATVPWYLTIKAASEEHLIEFETREAAKEALVRARAEIFEQASGRDGSATIEDQVVVSGADVRSITLHHARI